MSKKVGRNDPCPCGSGKKYKKCCLNKDLEREREEARKKEMEQETEEEIEKEIELDREKEIKRYFEILQNETPPQISILALMRNDQDLIEDGEWMKKISKEHRDLLLKKWNLNEVRKMSTLEIIEKLNSMHVEFDEESFREQAKEYISAIKLANDCYYTQDYCTEGLDEDFIWLAIIELWNRLMPDKFNIEMIDDAIQEGYKVLDNGDYKEGLEKWNKAWIIIKTIVPSYITSVEEVDDFMYNLLTQFIINWCQDYDMELGSAGLKDESYSMRRIEYCREFRQLFPDSDELIIQNMIRGEAEAYATLGNVNVAEKLFKEFIAEFPGDPWGYIGWADIYVWPAYRKVQKDLDKAEKIYRKGLEVCTYDKDVILDRLESLEDKKTESCVHKPKTR
jgi:hypothetical protein